MFCNLITLFIFRFNFVSIAIPVVTNSIFEPIINLGLAISLEKIVNSLPEHFQGQYPGAIAPGYVDRGQAIPELFGQYIFADVGRDVDFFFFLLLMNELILGKQAAIKQLKIL
ncbi:MAG: hypothetical protein Kow0049_00540 [Stanieria sp.]